MDGNNFFKENLNLAKTTASFWTKKTVLEFDDSHQLCLFGLYKASKTFQEGKGAIFSTWAITHMNNAVKDELRRMQRRVPEILMQNTSDDYGEETIHKGLEDFGECDLAIERIEESIQLSKVAKYIKELLTKREWEILWLISVEDVKQDEIAKRYGFQQPHVSRIMKNIKRKVMQNTSLCSLVESLGVL